MKVHYDAFAGDRAYLTWIDIIKLILGWTIHNDRWFVGRKKKNVDKTWQMSLPS